MTKIFVAQVDDGDWVAVYIDGIRNYEAHDVHWTTMLSLLYNRVIRPEDTVMESYDADAMADRDVNTFPETLEELSKLKLVVTHTQSPIKG